MYHLTDADAIYLSRYLLTLNNKSEKNLIVSVLLYLLATYQPLIIWEPQKITVH